jgi:menaquinone-9 beta-reductase
MTGAVVVGGGPAGAALAIRIARAGGRVTLCEREVGPVDKVCGEFLSREARLYIASLGLDLPALGAICIDEVRLCDRGRVTAVALPFSASSLSRRVLDEALLGAACRAGAVVRRGAKVVGLSRDGSRWAARLADGEVISADAAFLATGKHDLRGHKRPAGAQADLVAFKLHWRLAARQAAELRGCVELVAFDGGYAGLQPIENGRANLCVLVRRGRLRALAHRWDDLLAAMVAESPHLAARLAGAEPSGSRPLALSPIPYGHVQGRADGPWRLGDQAAVIPSFSGDGVSIALHSAGLAAATYFDGGDADAYQRRLAADVRWQVRLATVISQCLVRRPGRAALGVAARLWPGLVSALAVHTRVPDSALGRGLH